MDKLEAVIDQTLRVADPNWSGIMPRAFKEFRNGFSVAGIPAHRPDPVADVCRRLRDLELRVGTLEEARAGA